MHASAPSNSLSTEGEYIEKSFMITVFSFGCEANVEESGFRESAMMDVIEGFDRA